MRTQSNRRHVVRGSFVAAALLAAGVSAAQAQTGGGVLDPAAPPEWKASAEAESRAALGNIQPTKTFRNADLASGGVGLRNRRGGGIEIGGARGPVKAAFLYWAVLTDGAPPNAVKSMRIQRIFPGPPSTVRTVNGASVGQGPEPCWNSFNGATRITVFRGAVPTSVVTGNGSYVVTVSENGSGSGAGADPFATSPLPALEGASLVVVGRGNGRVALYDRQLAGKTFTTDDGQTYSLILPVNVSRASAVEFHSIGADGQNGAGNGVVAKTANEVTTMNGVPIGGSGSSLNDGHWNGSGAGPLPQLWDNIAQDVTGPAKRGNGTRLNLKIQAKNGNDCISPVANAVAIFGLGG
jgi:hypothetical protein